MPDEGDVEVADEVCVAGGVAEKEPDAAVRHPGDAAEDLPEPRRRKTPLADATLHKIRKFIFVC